MSDYLIRATTEDASVRALSAVTTNLVEEARRRHQTYPTVTAALGRLLTAGILMGALLKEKETVTLRVLADGPIGGMIVDANARGEVRGYAKNPKVYVPLNKQGKFDVAEAVGRNGHIYITYDLELKARYTGSAPIVSGEIARDLANYFVVSEQIPSIVSLGVLVGWEGVLAAGGFLIQLMPAGEDKSEKIPLLEKNVSSLESISTHIYQGKKPEDIINIALQGMQPKLLSKQSVCFQCHCNREKVKELLISLGEEELRELLNKEGKADARCHFCNESYLIEKEELEGLIQELASSRNNNAKHANLGT